MKLTSVIKLSLSSWLLSSGGIGRQQSEIIGRKQGDGYSQWSSPLLGSSGQHIENHHVLTEDPRAQDKGKEKALASQDPTQRHLSQPTLPQDLSDHTSMGINEIHEASWELSQNNDRQVMTGYTGAKDKGKGKASGSHHLDQDAHSSPSYSEELATNIILDAYDEGRFPESSEDLKGDPRLEYVYNTRGQGEHSKLDGWNGQFTNDQSLASEAWPLQHHDPYSEHLSWSYDQNAQPMIVHQCSGAQFNKPQSHRRWSGNAEGQPQKVHRKKFKYASGEIKNDWEAFNYMLTTTFYNAVNDAVSRKQSIDGSVAGRTRGYLAEAPPTWSISVVDNPFGAIEERISQWANQKRNELALRRGSDELVYMWRDKSTEKWIMKEDYSSSSSRITSHPADWFRKSAKWNPIAAYLEKKRKAADRAKKRASARKRQQGHD
ncbi:hypothetical protein FA10DRAFT_258392 [Acaromyces ingoldii]|uniref:Enterotoxin n=1 Tax=Acaromyces ingoldii TaxID=215250 RepID=A0A316YXP3_9BASI|nr:hypothetical protein FA10DRAFT_258392 [Acaromyces ingoldii]PWN94280.1 hypothetical protein FA10DRAFT_258392 [Acaromyces ingoldii]